MAKSGKQGRVPASQRDENKEIESEDDMDFTDLDFNLLQLDEAFRKELSDQGLVPRWINATKFIQGGNFHKSGWRAYKRPVTADRGSTDFSYGVSPDGYIIRNDLLLAVKSKRDNIRWGKKLAYETALRSGADATRAAELREAAMNAGVSGMKVLEGYDANDTSDDGDE